jgi:hypothetical protein
MKPRPKAEPIKVDDGFLAIAVDNSSMHYYASVAQLCADRSNWPDDSAVPYLVGDCFDCEGHRLAFGVDGNGVISSVWRTTGRPDPTLGARIDGVISRSAAGFRNSPRVRTLAKAGGEEQDVTVAEAMERLAELKNLMNGSNGEIFKALRTSPFGHAPAEDEQEPHDKDWAHNCLAHGRCF